MGAAHTRHGGRMRGAGRGGRRAWLSVGERTARPRQRSSATALSATGAKGWAIFTERSEFHCAPRSERLRPPQLTVLSTTLLVTNLLLLSRRRATRRAPAPPACTSDNTLLHKLHLSIMSYLPWLKWRGGCGWVAKLSRSCCWNTGLQLQQPVSLLQGGIKPRSILRCGISNCPLQTSLATALHRRAVLVLRPPRLHAPSSCPAARLGYLGPSCPPSPSARLGCLGPSWPPFPSAWRQRCPSPYCP